MGAELSPASSRSSEESSRRRLLTLMGAGGAAALATMVTSKEAQAGHDFTNVMHLGEFNNAPAGSSGDFSTALAANSSIFAFRVHNENGGSQSGGILASSQGGHSAVTGHAFGSAVGVRGVSFSSTGGPGAQVGVTGTSGSGIGVEGGAPSGVGVNGHSDTGVGGAFSSNSGDSLHCDGPAGIFSNAEGGALTVGNEHPDGDGISASSSGHHAVEGVNLSNDPQPGQAGVVGVSGEGEFYGAGPGTGVLGASGSGVGVAGFSPSTGTAVHGNSLQGIGVSAECEQGRALQVRGKAAFSTVGSASVPAGQSSVFVANDAVTADSHISVTLVGNPGLRAVQWVERAPDSGFTVHLTLAGPKPETPLTYFVVEPA